MTNNVLTFEQFKGKILESKECGTALDKISDSYSNIPVFFRTLTNLEPTGIASAINQVLSENKEKRERENILYALYKLYEIIHKIGHVLNNIERPYILQQGPVLTHLYFEHSKEAYSDKKIDWFRNVWANGLIDIKRELGEKAYIFELLRSLPIEQVLTLKFIYEKQHMLSFEDRKPVNIEEIAKTLDTDVSHAQQICISLQGRGLLYDYSIGRFDYPGPVKFVMTEYVKLIVNYIEEPRVPGG